jgi:hypothetical protein
VVVPPFAPNDHRLPSGNPSGCRHAYSFGGNIYCRRDGDTGPVFLARDTASPYVDNRPLLVAGKPEVHEYRATDVLADAEIGNPSDEAVITATP